MQQYSFKYNTQPLNIEFVNIMWNNEGLSIVYYKIDLNMAPLLFLTCPNSVKQTVWKEIKGSAIKYENSTNICPND